MQSRAPPQQTALASEPAVPLGHNPEESASTVELFITAKGRDKEVEGAKRVTQVRTWVNASESAPVQVQHSTIPAIIHVRVRAHRSNWNQPVLLVGSSKPVGRSRMWSSQRAKSGQVR